MLYTKNRLFAKNGHECEITYVDDELPMFIPSTRTHIRVYRKLVRMRMASEINRRGNFFLRSQGAIATEHYRHLKFLYMIHPFSDIRTYWEMVMMIVYCYCFVTIPLDIVFFHLREMTVFKTGVSWAFCRTLADFMCLLDCIMNFLTGYYDMEAKEVVMTPKKVWNRYIKTYFFFDVVSSIPIHSSVYILGHDVLHIFIYLSIFKLVRYISFRRCFFGFAENLNLPHVLSRVTLSILAFLIYFHCVTCFFLYVFGISYYYDETSIYYFKDNERVNITSGYFHTMYLMTLIILTSGYGNSLEMTLFKILTICIWILSKCLHIILLARIIEIVSAITASSHKYVILVQQLKEYMRHKQLPDYFKKRLLSYYEFRFQKSFFREADILNTISGQLRQEIIMHSCRKLVENVGFFRNLPLPLLLRIVTSLHLEIYLVNDVIVKANSLGDSMYFISSGTVAVFTKSGKEVCHLEDGDYFGEIALVMNEDLRAASVVAVEICELYMLERKDFVRAIYPYPDLLNAVTRIAADRLDRTNIMDEHHRRELNIKRM